MGKEVLTKEQFLSGVRFIHKSYFLYYSGYFHSINTKSFFYNKEENVSELSHIRNDDFSTVFLVIDVQEKYAELQYLTINGLKKLKIEFKDFLILE